MTDLTSAAWQKQSNSGEKIEEVVKVITKLKSRMLRLMFSCRERYQGKLASQGKKHQKRVNFWGKEQVKVGGVTISISVGIMQTAFEWLFCWKLGENTTGFGKITKETEMQKKQKLQKGEKKKMGACLSQFVRPVWKHTSSLFLLAVHLYYLDSGLTWEDVNQHMPEHTWGHMWEQRTVSMAKSTHVRTGTGTHA